MLLKNKTACHGTLFLDVNNSRNLRKRTNSEQCKRFAPVCTQRSLAEREYNRFEFQYIDIFHMETQSEYILTSPHAQQKFFHAYIRS